MQARSALPGATALACELQQAAYEAVRSSSQGYLEGQDLSKILRDRHGRSVEAFTGGGTVKQRKGWLKQLVQSEPRIAPLNLPGRSDVVYIVAGEPPPVLPQAAAADGRPRGAKRPLEVLAVEPPADGAGDLSLEAHGPALADAALRALGSDPGAVENGYLEASRLARLMHLEQPALCRKAQLALGSDWLRRLFEVEARVVELELTGVPEPVWSFSPGAELLPPPPLPTGAAAPPRPPRACGRPEVLRALATLAVCVLEGVPEYMEGTRLAEALKQQQAGLVEETKAALGGKGWLKKLVESDERLAAVTVQGLDEPCYSLRRKLTSAPFRRRDGNPAEKSGEAGGREEAAEKRPRVERTGEQVREALGEDLVRLCDAAVAFVEEARAQGGADYLEGSRLASRLKVQLEAVVERAKVALGGKGWLKSALELEPRLVRVEVERSGEPCWTLAAP